jgi:hypothetical protein
MIRAYAPSRRYHASRMTVARGITRSIIWTIVTLIAPIVAGCRTGANQPEAQSLAPPAVAQTRVTYFSGSPLSGPTTRQIASTKAEDTLAVKVTFVALAKMPTDSALEPLTSRSRLVAATSGGVPVLATGRLTQTARIATTQPDLGVSAEISSEAGALPIGATAVFVTGDAGSTDFSNRRRVEIALRRPSTAPSVEIALAVGDFVTPAPPEAAKTEEADRATLPQAPPAQKPEFQREMTLLDPIPVTDATSIVLVVPFRFTGGNGRAVAAIIELSPGADTPEQRDALAHVSEELKRSSEQAAKRPDVAPLESSEWASMRGAVESLYWPERRRSALVFLSNQTGARICEDVALVADDATLARMCEPIVTRVNDDPLLHTREALGWLLDQSSFKLLAESLAGGKMPPELEAVLTQHAGEAGRHAGSLDEVMRGTGNRQDLENKLTAENFIFLEDSSPASRVRAFDWLRARGRAPAGYEPLGNMKDRREALERSLAAPASAPKTSMSGVR